MNMGHLNMLRQHLKIAKMQQGQLNKLVKMNKTDGKSVKPEEARDGGYDDKINNLFANLKPNAHYVSKTVLKKKRGADGVLRTVKEEVKEEVAGDSNAMG